ncbi:mycothiol system anti-sigma-R factor [Rothia terrae]|jgi:mycothiol system anti-sigma-R factor|uniref:Mycothiol system anti-sigma-R factor n=1 Tax=Rothia terrae TaxID=396015 RepID=A0A7H2BFT1_9MICC|nr:mycothiol system anti-sigma-R factor [Rothia terrae]QNV38527.1 mycothiol system anti-sigma-R factor [Rothia terrae]
MTDSSDKSQNCCEQEINKIYEYLDGAVSKEDVETFKKHLGECTDCTQEHDLEVMIREAIKRSCCEKAPQELKDKIRISIDEIKNKA